MNKILGFRGEYRFLSNFEPVEVEYRMKTFKSVEHAYQAAKTEDENLIKEIQQAGSPSIAKKLGRKLEIRYDWEAIKVNTMYKLIGRKFDCMGCEEHIALAKRLFETGDAELIEDNNWGDVFWGICNGKGHNMLGKLLMIQRTKIIKLGAFDQFSTELEDEES